MKISKLMNGVAATALSSVLALGQMGSAQADDAAPSQQQQAQPVSTQQGELNSAQMLDLASAYSKENGGRVGIFLNIAPDTKYTPEQIGNAIVAKFAQEGIEAAYVTNHASRGKSSVSFYMNGMVWPGYSIGASPRAFEEVVKTYRALKAEQAASQPVASLN